MTYWLRCVNLSLPLLMRLLNEWVPCLVCFNTNTVSLALDFFFFFFFFAQACWSTYWGIYKHISVPLRKFKLVARRVKIDMECAAGLRRQYILAVLQHDCIQTEIALQRRYLLFCCKYYKYCHRVYWKHQYFHDCEVRVKIWMFSSHEMKILWYSLKKE